MPSFKSLTGKLRKETRAKVKARQANMPKTMKKTGRRQMIKSAKENIGQASGRFLDHFAKETGFSEYREERKLRKKSNGGFGVSLGSSTRVTDLPTLDTPQRVVSPTSASISTVSKQLTAIADVATRIGAITKEQQDTLVKQLRNSNRLIKEQQMETPAQTLEPSESSLTGDSIGPGQDTIADFYKAISELTEIIEDKTREQQDNSASGRFLDHFAKETGFGEFREERKAKGKQANLKKGFSFNEKLGAYQGPDGKTVKEADALKNFTKVDPSNLKTRTGKLAQAEAVAKPGLIRRGTSKVTSSLAGVIGKSAKASAVTGAIAAGGSVSKDAITKIATPLVKSALAKTAVKSIPIVGAVAGVGFAINRLLQGDVVGAGLDAASGIAGPVTAIPALAASLSRDVYSSTFGIQPEADPMFGSRMAMVSGIVGMLIKGWLSNTVKPTKSGDTPAQPLSSTPTPIKTPPVSNPPANTPKPFDATGGAMAQATAAITSATGTKSSGGSGPKAATGNTPVSKPTTGGGMPNVDALVKSAELKETSDAEKMSVNTQSGKQLEGEEGSAPVESTPARIEKALSGEKVLNASMETPSSTPSVSTKSNPPIQPAKAPTTRSGAKGTGDVPDPTYFDMSSFAGQLYFGATAEAMT